MGTFVKYSVQSSLRELRLMSHKSDYSLLAVADPGGEMAIPPGPIKISPKKADHRRRPHIFHVSPPYPAAGSTTALILSFV